MTRQNIVVENLFNGESVLSNQEVMIEDGVIVSISEVKDVDKVLTGILAPGYIDLQVNGGGGYLFNQSPTAESLEFIAKAHQQFGTTGWLATLITDELGVLLRAAVAVANARLNKASGILGIHFEGPHLSKTKKGVHSEASIREISAQEMDIFLRKDLGRVLVTVAPENATCDQIKKLVENGVVVCLGHSNADFETVNKAIESGATGFTHLYNAMSQLNAREPGMVGAALTNSNLAYGIILDGIHMHPAAAKVAYLANKNMILVTDAMPPVGVDGKSFELPSGMVTRNHNKLTDSEGRLAGSVLDMSTAVKNAQEFLDISLEKAINLASKLPAKFIGLESVYGTIEVGKKASFILLDKNNQVQASWIDGIKVI
jgi:N-acetylglucosamine-6-phosphate deacetylase